MEKFWEFMGSLAIVMVATSMGLVAIGAASRFLWCCLKAGWNLFGLFLPG
jgi:hypothetical protein